jgi:hypothetical protein
MTRKDDAEKQEAITELRKLCLPGTTVYTITRHVARSGMYRAIDAYVMVRNSPVRISFDAARACGFRYDHKHEGVSMSGCGMDMGFHLVNTLSYALHGMKSKGDGAKPENAGHPFTPRRGHYRAGYSLNHWWL